MKAWLGVVSGFLLVVTIIVGVRMQVQANELGRDGVQLQQTRSELAQVSAKAAGAHRDLITCADLQALGLQTLLDIGLNTNADGSLSAVPDEVPVQLPSHCINQ